MNAIKSIAVLSGLTFITISSISQEPPVIVANEQKKDADVKAVSIPKSEIYTTSDEPGFKKKMVALFWPNKDGPDKAVHPYSYALQGLQNAGMPGPNVFVVRGEEIKDAISATRLLRSGGSVDEPPKYDADDREIVSKRHWLVVYLGTFGSEPPRWEFKSMSVSDRMIEFAYSKTKSRYTTHDVWQYYYWVELPELRKGTYELRLFDSDKKRPSLIRVVEIP